MVCGDCDVYCIWMVVVVVVCLLCYVEVVFVLGVYVFGCLGLSV